MSQLNLCLLTPIGENTHHIFSEKATISQLGGFIFTLFAINFKSTSIIAILVGKDLPLLLGWGGRFKINPSKTWEWIQFHKHHFFFHIKRQFPPQSQET